MSSPVSDVITTTKPIHPSTDSILFLFSFFQTHLVAIPRAYKCILTVLMGSKMNNFQYVISFIEIAILIDNLLTIGVLVDE